jgi:hypothetical protein
VTVTWSRPSPSRAQGFGAQQHPGSGDQLVREASIEGGHRAANVAVPVLAEATAVTEYGERPDVAGGAFQRSVRRRIWGVEEDPRSYDGPLWSRP